MNPVNPVVVYVLVALGAIAAKELVQRLLFPKASDALPPLMKLEIRDAMKESLTTNVMPIMQAQTEILKVVSATLQAVQLSLRELTTLEHRARN